MATQDLLMQLVQGVINNPSLLGNFEEHPYSTIREAAGIEEEIPREEASEVLAAFSSLAGGKAVDFGSLSSLASGMLAKNNNSVHTMASSLFNSDMLSRLLSSAGVASEEAAPAASAKAGMSGIAIQTILGNLVSAVGKSELGGIKGLDLSDGFGLDDVLGIAKNLL